MAFQKEVVVTPVSIGAIAISMYDPKPGSEEAQSATVAVQVEFSDGKVVERTFDLADHVTPQVITQLQALALDLRTKAQALL